MTRVRAVRRTQAERTAATRERIMRAVVASIAEIGFQKTTANEITRRAGVTWGAVQHHFGGKDGILDAVLEESFERFAVRLAAVPTEGASLAERVSAFVDIAWEHFGSPDYRSTFEILLNYTREADSDEPPIWESEMFSAWNRVWATIFADVSLPRRKVVALQAFSISAVSGMAALAMLRRAAEPVHGAELDLLKKTLVREMSGE
ncbi:MAG TPA: TetR/AcrR family transcriptional regulator [Myxococcota bacterium]|nr:TetR/AcrR family transcriptional regulator [Myxococcota bacterium]